MTENDDNQPQNVIGERLYKIAAGLIALALTGGALISAIGTA